MAAFLLTLAILGSGWAMPKSPFEHINCAAKKPTAQYAGACFVYHEPGAPSAGLGWSTNAAYEMEEDVFYYPSASTADMWWDFEIGEVSGGSPTGLPGVVHGMHVISYWDGSTDWVYFRKANYEAGLSLFKITSSWPTPAQRPPIAEFLAITAKAIERFDATASRRHA